MSQSDLIKIAWIWLRHILGVRIIIFMSRIIDYHNLRVGKKREGLEKQKYSRWPCFCLSANLANNLSMNACLSFSLSSN